jgi:hypothetical protein
MGQQTIMIAVAALVAVMALRPATLRSRLWRAMVTPLASIIGSGFLIAGPILAHVAGNWAFLGMAFLCAAAFLFGAAVRRNILLVESSGPGGLPGHLATVEHLSEFAIAFAYFISVTYYLNLFAAFLLKAEAIVDPLYIRIAATVVIATLGMVGGLRGLGGLERIEVSAVGLKLSIIAGLLAALLFFDARALSQHSLALPTLSHDSGLKEAGVLLGLIILVQGFETSRYLGAEYDAEMRVRTMRMAQILSTAIYIAFILLITPFFSGTLPRIGGETAIIDLLTPLGAAVGPLLIFAALASQLSAAVADMNGASGLLYDASKQRIPIKVGYIATAAFAVALTWVANIYEIITFASKAFALYYGLQCYLAAMITLRKDRQNARVLVPLFLAGTALAGAIVIFGIPAETGQ